MHRSPILPLVLGLVATVAHGQQQARIVKYHANDIVSVRAKMRYTTLIELPGTEKILEVATGDKDFWIIDTVGNYCFLHPAKVGIHSNLNLITDKGTVYSFVLDDVETGDPDLKVVIEPSDPSSLAAANGAGKLVSAGEVEAARAQAQVAQTRASAAVEQFRADYPTHALKFDYSFHNEKPLRCVGHLSRRQVHLHQVVGLGEVLHLRVEGRQARPHHLPVEGWHLRHPDRGR